MIRDRVHRYQDAKRLEAYQVEKTQIEERQAAERLQLQRSQEMQSLDMERQRRGLAQTEERERKSLAMTFQRERNLALRAGHEQMPALHLTLSPPGRPAMLNKAANRFKGRPVDEGPEPKRRVSLDEGNGAEFLQQDFRRAAGTGNLDNNLSNGSSKVGSSQESRPGARTGSLSNKSPDNDHERDR